jgi:hypothetical protein
MPYTPFHARTRNKAKLQSFRMSSLILQEAEEVFVTTLDDLERQAKTENIEIFNRQIFKDDPSAAVANLKRQVRA